MDGPGYNSEPALFAGESQKPLGRAAVHRNRAKPPAKNPGLRFDDPANAVAVGRARVLGEGFRKMVSDHDLECRASRFARCVLDGRPGGPEWTAGVPPCLAARLPRRAPTTRCHGQCCALELAPVAGTRTGSGALTLPQDCHAKRMERFDLHCECGLNPRKRRSG